MAAPGDGGDPLLPGRGGGDPQAVLPTGARGAGPRPADAVTVRTAIRLTWKITHTVSIKASGGETFYGLRAQGLKPPAPTAPG